MKNTYQYDEKINEIKERLRENVSQEYIEDLQKDTRIGVVKLVASYLKRQQKIAKEQQRIAQMWKYEDEAIEKGYARVAGIDEVGRGPLAGPVVASAVILPRDFDATGMNDSKKLTPEERIRLRKHIEKHAVSIGIGRVDVDYIDRYNILLATLEAMRIAVSQLTPQPDLLLVDAIKIPQLVVAQKNIIKGDELSHSIAAASIVAKTTRDEWMRTMALSYPEYGFDEHVGYGTVQHLKAIKKYGPTPIHRQSFSPFKEKVL